MTVKTLFENMTASLALQNVYIQLCTLPLHLEPGCGALIGGFGPNVKLYFQMLSYVVTMAKIRFFSEAGGS